MNRSTTEVHEGARLVYTIKGILSAAKQTMGDVQQMSHRTKEIEVTAYTVNKSIQQNAQVSLQVAKGAEIVRESSTVQSEVVITLTRTVGELTKSVTKLETIFRHYMLPENK
ncbi:MAG: hypothetical protein ABS948_11075 [Solibacillus sp.]